MEIHFEEMHFLERFLNKSIRIPNGVLWGFGDSIIDTTYVKIIFFNTLYIVDIKESVMSFEVVL